MLDPRPLVLMLGLAVGSAACEPCENEAIRCRGFGPLGECLDPETICADDKCTTQEDCEEGVCRDGYCEPPVGE